MKRDASMRALEDIFLLLTLAVGLAVFYGSMNTSSFLAGNGLTAKTYGMIIAGALTLVTAGKLVVNVAQTVRHDQGERITFQEIQRLLICAALMIVYCYGINHIGYFTSTTIFFFLMLLILNAKRSVKAALICAACSLAFSVALHYLFQVMKVMMPNTPLP